LVLGGVAGEGDMNLNIGRSLRAVGLDVFGADSAIVAAVVVPFPSVVFIPVVPASATVLIAPIAAAEGVSTLSCIGVMNAN
jgi:hypothetical protein